jgi:hypothetical protein
MRRGFWFVAGAGVGVWATTKVQRVAEAFTPDGLRDRVRGLGVGARMFRDEVAQGAVEKEIELRAQLGLAPHGRADRPELTSAPSFDRRQITDADQ